MRSSDVAMSAVMLVIFTVMTAIALATFPEGARFQPLVVGIPAIALSVLQLVLDLRAKTAVRSLELSRSSNVSPAPLQGGDGGGGQDDSEVPGCADKSLSSVTPPPPPPRQGEGSSSVELEPLPRPVRELRAWAWFLALIAGVLLLGFWITIPVFLIAFLHIEASTPLPRAVVVGGVASAALYALFAVLLKAALHEGFLVQWIKG